MTEDWYVFEQISGQGKRELIGTSVFKATFTEPRIAVNKKELTFRIDICPEGEKLQQTGRENYNVLLRVRARNNFNKINYREKLCNLVLHIRRTSTKYFDVSIYFI